MSEWTHRPVLFDEVLDGLAIQPDGIYVDGTFGRGGHSQAILSRLSEQGKLLVFDKDPEAIAVAQSWQDPRVEIVRGSFTQLAQQAEARGYLGKVNGILLDLGVSSPQLDNAERGFSFNKNGPLDMRMDPDSGISAAQWLAETDEQEIARVLWWYGEERFSRRIAAAIVARRAEAPINTTQELAELIKESVPKLEKRIHPATRSFQGIRIAINNELTDLEDVLSQSLSVLAVTGRLCVISFHSLEDRLVKRFIQQGAQGDDVPSGVPMPDAALNRRLKKVGRLVRASDQEVTENARARSARLRIAEKLA